MTEPAKIPLVRNEVTSYDFNITRPILVKIYLIELVRSYTIVLKRLLLIQVMSGKVRQQLFKQI